MAAPPSLYRKYRPRGFADLVGQEHVTRSVRNAIKAGLVSHAYLFCGPRGCGKTSLAKIIGKTVNCAAPKEGEPCNECTSCTEANSGTNLDIVEIDAASNRKIDDIRHLREQVSYGPVSGDKKVYIIDEAHMLTKEASNAFLKTLEEPPSHVIFILCTTEPEAIIPTILSRCQRYDFRKLGVDPCLKRLEMVISQEQPLEVTEEARYFLALRGDGSMRDVLGLLDQAISYCGRKIDRPDIERTLGLVRIDVIDGIVQSIIDGKSGEVIRSVEDVSRSGTDMSTLLNQLVERFRTLLLVKSGNADLLQRVVAQETLQRLQKMAEALSEPRLLAVLQTLSSVLSDLKHGLMPVFALEVGLISAIHAGTAMAAPVVVQAQYAPPASRAQAQAPAGHRGHGGPAGRPAPQRQQAPVQAVPSGGAPAAHAGHAPAAPAPAASGSDGALWQQMTSRMRREYPLTYAFIVEAKFGGREGDVLTITFDKKHAFHKSKLQEVKHEAILKKFVHEDFGPTVTPRLVEADGSPSEAAPTPAARSTKRKSRSKSSSRQPAPEEKKPITEGKDWYEQKALKNRKVQELREAFEADVVSIE